MRKIKPMFPTVIASLNVHALMALPRISVGAHCDGVFFCLLCALWLPCIRMPALHQQPVCHECARHAICARRHAIPVHNRRYARRAVPG